MSTKKNRRDSFNFFNPRWSEAVPGLAAAVWTRKDASWFSGPYERIADMLLWVVRERDGRPIMACFRPRIDPKVAVAMVDPSTRVGAWDLSLRACPGAIAAGEHLACAVADLFVRQWTRAAVGSFAAPSAYVGYGGRIRVRRTPELAERVGDEATEVAIGEAWDKVPTLARDPEHRSGGQVFLYPAKFVSSDSMAPAVHPETMESRPSEGVLSAPGWVRRDGGWVPAAPAGRGIMFASTRALAGLEVENPAFAIYKEFGLVDKKTRRDDFAAVEAAASRLADPVEFTAADRMSLTSAMWKRLARRTKFTPNDLLDALLHPQRPLVASTYPRVASFRDADLAEAAGRGWAFDFSEGRVAAAVVDDAVAVAAR